MPRKKYTVGIDFGTESARTVLVDVSNGREVASEVYNYSHGVMDEVLPDGRRRLGPDWALQDPEDYIRALKATVPRCLRPARVKPEDVIGIGTDFTACSMLPIDEKGVPLCTKGEFRREPNAWVKLWKHHAAQAQADKVNRGARERREPWLSRYGGKISSEWLFPKILQTLEEAPRVYEAADRFIEGADWIILRLCGEEKRNLTTAGYKAIWDKHTGYPSKEYFKALDSRLENVVDEKLSRDIHPLGERAGGLTPQMAKLTGLLPGTCVAVGNVDAHVVVPACTVVEPGKMVMIMGTSICHMVLGRELKIVEGMCGVVEDGIILGYFGFEAGQTAVGDIYAWCVENIIPPAYHREAKRKKMSLHDVLQRKAAKLAVGESGLLALDWWNGNRSILVDADLTGMMLGMTLLTRPEEIYRAIIEATAYGTYTIIRALESAGVTVGEICCCGGLAQKNELVMQIFADVTGRSLKVARSLHTSALGSAMFAAVAAGSSLGGYDSIEEAAKRMARIRKKAYEPHRDCHKAYRELFAEYSLLHDYFGRGGNDVMKRLKKIKAKARGARRSRLALLKKS